MTQVVLEVRSGVLAGNKISVQSGQVVRVGRTRRADFAVPQDSMMSGLHFAVECDANGCILRDLGSSNGTLVNGLRVNTAVLGHGDLVVAGMTTFVVQVVRSAVEPRPAPVAVAPVPAGEPRPLLELLRGQFQPLYAVLDAAREPSVLKVLFESKEHYQSLYEGPQAGQLAHFAPYLVRLQEKSPLLETLAQTAWGKSWGMYLTSDKPFAEVRNHLRRFLIVSAPEGKQVYFRFYDPRVLRVFLPTCTPVEMNQIFGPVKYFVTEDSDPKSLLRFSNEIRGVGKRVFPILPPIPEAQSLSAARFEQTAPLAD